MELKLWTEFPFFPASLRRDRSLDSDISFKCSRDRMNEILDFVLKFSVSAQLGLSPARFRRQGTKVPSHYSISRLCWTVVDHAPQILMGD